MIKVCFFISAFDFSGAEIVLNRYLYNNKIIDPYFILIYNNKTIMNKYIDIYGENKVFSLNINHKKNRLRFIPWIDIQKIYFKSKKILKKINPNVLYMNNTHEMMLCKKIVKKSHLKSIAHIHDMRKSIKSPIKRYLMDNSINIYDKVITVSEATKKEWNDKKIQVIYNGIDKEYISEETIFKKEIKKIGFVGKISKRKGFDLIYTAYKNHQLLKDKKLLIAYSAIESELEEIFVDLDNFKNITKYSNLKYEEMKTFYDEIDLLVVPSKADPLPTVIIEAMARGCLIIGSDVDGIPELLGNTELLFDVNNIKSFENKLLKVISLDNNNITEVSKNLKQRCVDKFMNDKKVNLINKIINELCSQN